MTDQPQAPFQADFQASLAARARDVERVLDALLDARPEAGEIGRPERLLAAMRHGVLNGGKRLRPFLVVETAALFTRSAERLDAACRVGAALECIHCYSLIHDDLPAMDDDDLRRGQPTVHKAYDEATAILAGDALMTLAFDAVASEKTVLDPLAKVHLVSGLARAAGIGGMAGGQALDLAAERDAPDEAGIITLQAMKTGALIRFACEAGGIVGGASAAQREGMAEYGAAIGLAFQLADDILDATASTEALGKRAGKDAQAGKGTLVALHGLDWTREQLGGLVEQAESLLAPHGARAATLRAATRFIATRGN
ncbi:MAG: polyprenyl synthetase family protein [Methylobacterium mesophilicum]|nr:polyprenyl synthetase family protein [Methylobacterium mesophilicum]